MSSQKTKVTTLVLSLCGAIVLMLLVSFTGLGQAAAGRRDLTGPVRAVSLGFLDLPLAETNVISGTYVGTVAITEPVQLGVLDLSFDLVEDDGTLAGTLNVTRTLAYPHSVALSGSLTGYVNGITPTLSLASEVFTDTVSGRPVDRRFQLVGEAWQEGEILYGLYTENITGFTPQPLTTQGLFMVVRAPQIGPSSRIFLPIIQKGAPWYQPGQ